MLFPANGGVDDGRSVFVKVLNKTDKPFEPNGLVLIPRDAELKDDYRYIQNAWAKVDHHYILPGQYGIAKLLDATFYAD